MSVEAGINFRAYHIPPSDPAESIVQQMMYAQLNEITGGSLERKLPPKSNRVPFFAEMAQRILDRLIGTLPVITVSRETHAEIEHALVRATRALKGEEGYESLERDNAIARALFKGTDLPRIAHLITRPGRMEMIFRPKIGDIEIITTEKNVEYRIHPKTTQR